VKKKIRYLGIAESFLKEDKKVGKKSLIAGVIMRGDLQIDGLGFEFTTIGGLDATNSIISLIRKLNRPDIRVVLLGGVIISLYNVIDLKEVYNATNIPLIAVTYRESKGIENILLEKENGRQRLEIYIKNGKRIPIVLKNGYTVYVRFFGLSLEEVYEILNNTVIHGRYPEPIRVAKLIARSVLKMIRDSGKDVLYLIPE